MKPFNILNLKTISGQIAALVLASIVALHLIIVASFHLSRINQPPPSALDARSELALAAHVLAAAPVAERERLMADLNRAFPGLALEGLQSGAGSEAEFGHVNLRALIRHLGEGYKVRVLAEDRRVGIELPDRAMISANLGALPPPPPFLGGPWMMTILFAVISVSLLGLWAARALATPLSSFAKAAESFSLSSGAEPLPERGPEEVRALARALNHMRERITGLIDDRTTMLAAISHDLRTPITRLRLRSEFIEDEAQRLQMFADLDQMQKMLTAVLSLLRNANTPERRTLTDVASSLQIVADQFSDVGHNVIYAGPDRAMAMVAPDDLQRCVTNLVENAVRFGSETRIRFALSGDHLLIEVEDDGPGIPDALKQAVMQPFVRGDGARNMDGVVGFGLGLSIANAIVAAHGGTMMLLDRLPQGLRVCIRLPAGECGELLQA